MRFRRTSLLLGASLLAAACTTDNHGHPVRQGLYEPVTKTETYYKNIAKLTNSSKVQLEGLEEGHMAAQFNQEGLELGFIAPGKLQLKIFLVLLDGDGNEVPGAFSKQPFPEPIYVDRDVNRISVDIEDLVDCISKNMAKKITEDDNPDIINWINDGSIRVSYEINILENGITAPTGTPHFIDAPYFTGERIELLAWPEHQQSIAQDIITVTYTPRPVTTCTSNGKTTSCTTTIVMDPHYHDQAQLVMDVVGEANGIERSNENAKKYFEDNQVVELTIRDRNGDTNTSLNGKLFITTENAVLSFYIDQAAEGEILKVNVPNWAGDIKDASFVGYAPVDFRDGSFDKIDAQFSLAG